MGIDKEKERQKEQFLSYFQKIQIFLLCVEIKMCLSAPISVPDLTNKR